MNTEATTIVRTTFPGQRGLDLYHLYRHGEYIPCLSIEEAAGALRVSSRTVRRLVAARRLSHLRVGRRVLLLTEDVDRFLQDRAVRAVA